MVDESGSLGYASDGMPATDPTSQRVPALQELLGGLATLSQGAGSVSVSAGLFGFSSDTNVVQPFGSLSAASLGAFDASAATYSQQDKGPDTDFYTALSAAEVQLADAAGADGGNSCQALVMFTDGTYSFSVRPGVSRPYAPGGSADTEADAQSLAAAGQAAVCNGGGLIDQIRADQTYVVTVGLGPGSNQGADFLAGLAGAGGCGTQPAPGGLYLPAANVSDLLEAFDVASGELRGGTDVGNTSTNPRPFYLGADLRSIELIAHGGSTATTITLTAPDGQELNLPSTTAGSFHGLRFTSEDQSGSLNVTASASGDPSAWQGQWSLLTHAQPGSQTTTDILEVGDLTPTLSSSHTVYRGRPATLQVALAQPDGKPGLPAELAAPHLLIGQVSSPGATSPASSISFSRQPDGTFEGSFHPPADSPVSSLNLTLISEGLGPTGEVLTQVQRNVTIGVSLPPAYPTIRPSRLTFGTVTGQDEAATSFTATGGSAPSCIVVSGLQVTHAPRGVRSPEVRGAGGCTPVGARQVVVFHLRLTHRGSGSGSLQASLDLSVRPAHGATAKLLIPATASFVQPLHTARLVLVLVVLLVAGILLPLLFMYLLAYLGSRFNPPGLLRTAEIPVAVTMAAVRETDPDRDLRATALAPNARPIPESSRHPRQIDLPDGTTLRTRMALSPFAPPTATAVHPSSPIVSTLGTEEDQGSWAGRLSPRLGAGWVFKVQEMGKDDGGEPQLRGTVVLLCEETETQPDPWTDAVAQISTRLPELCGPLLKEAENLDRAEQDQNREEPIEEDPLFSIDLFGDDQD